MVMPTIPNTIPSMFSMFPIGFPMVLKLSNYLLLHDYNVYLYDPIIHDYNNDTRVVVR